MFESRISARATEKLPESDHVKKCGKIFANRTSEQLYEVSSPCLDDHHFKREELETVGELSKVCSQTELKCLCLARSGRPDILWSVDKLARTDKMDKSM